MKKMVLETRINSRGNVQWSIQSEQQPKNQSFSSIGRQSSIYSLTLDEFQHTLSESGKNFGSMNMDEFISSIWNAEENPNSTTTTTATTNTNSSHVSLFKTSADKALRKQPSLLRQGSLTLPSQLCRKTVDEVWSEILKGQEVRQQNSNNNSDSVQNLDSAPRQSTLGEMTLEDFLVKGGIVRESCPMTAPTSQQQYGLGSNNDPASGSSFVLRPSIGMPGAAGGADNTVAPGGGVVGGEPSGYAGRVVDGRGYGGRVVNDSGGYGVTSMMGMAVPVSPVSPDGTGTSDNSRSRFGVEMGVLKGRKRIIDGPMEKVLERRQRRMIKNRESAARSRARKQAYTIELEAELNQLREENSQLKQALAELETRRKQQCLDELNTRLEIKEKDKFRVLRRNLSCPL